MINRFLLYNMPALFLFFLVVALFFLLNPRCNQSDGKAPDDQKQTKDTVWSLDSLDWSDPNENSLEQQMEDFYNNQAPSNLSMKLYSIVFKDAHHVTPVTVWADKMETDGNSVTFLRLRPGPCYEIMLLVNIEMIEYVQTISQNP